MNFTSYFVVLYCTSSFLNCSSRHFTVYEKYEGEPFPVLNVETVLVLRHFGLVLSAKEPNGKKTLFELV